MKPPHTSSSNGHIDWPSILSRHDRWLRTVIYARLGDGHAVDEVLQEVALAAVRQSAPLRDVTKVAPWLYRLAIRHTLLYRRRYGRQRHLVQRYMDEAASAPRDLADSGTGNPLGWLLAAERQTLVRAALDRMPPRDAELLLLKYTQQWTYREIAQHLGVSAAAVESRLHRARRRLRRELSSFELIEAENR